MNIIRRDDWSPQEARGTYRRMSSVEGIIVHHTVTRAALPPWDEIRAILADHLSRPRWIDIGYNFLISREGMIFEGRPEVDGRPVHGAHSPGLNATRIGIALLGDFRIRQPRAVQIVSLVGLCQWCAVRYAIRPLRISAHGDHRSTECPGARMLEMMDTVRALVSRPFATQVDVETGDA